MNSDRQTPCCALFLLVFTCGRALPAGYAEEAHYYNTGAEEHLEATIHCDPAQDSIKAEPHSQGFDFNTAHRQYWRRITEDICPARSSHSCSGDSRQEWTSAAGARIHMSPPLFAGVWNTVQLRTFRADGSPKTAGGDAWTAVLHDPTRCVRVAARVFDEGNGTYAVAFFAHSPGVYDVVARLAYSACNGAMEPPRGAARGVLSEADSCYIGEKVVIPHAIAVGLSHASTTCLLRQPSSGNAHALGDGVEGAGVSPGGPGGDFNLRGLTSQAGERLRSGVRDMPEQTLVKDQAEGVVIRGEEAAVREGDTIRFLPCCTSVLQEQLHSHPQRFSLESSRARHPLSSSPHVQGDSNDEKPNSSPERQSDMAANDLLQSPSLARKLMLGAASQSYSAHELITKRGSANHLHSAVFRPFSAGPQRASRLLLWGDSTVKRQWLLLLMLARQHCAIEWQPYLFDELYTPDMCTPPPAGALADPALETALQRCTGGLSWTRMPVATNTVEVSRYFPDAGLVDMHNSSFWDEVLAPAVGALGEGQSILGFHTSSGVNESASKGGLGRGGEGARKLADGDRGIGSEETFDRAEPEEQKVEAGPANQRVGAGGTDEGLGLKYVVYLDGMGCRDLSHVKRDLETTTQAGDLLVFNMGLHCILGHSFEQWQAYVAELAPFLASLPASVVWRSSFGLREHVWRLKKPWAASMQAETELRRSIFDSVAEDVMVSHGITVWDVNGLLDLGEYRPWDMRHADAYTTRALNLQMAELLLC